MSEKSDLRVRKTQKAIKNAFTEMLLEMDYEKITIKELCERATINRRTFYLHYDTIDDLLFSIQKDITKEFFDRIKNYDIIQNIEQCTREYFIYSEEKGKIMEVINCNTNLDYVRQQMVNTVSQKSIDFNNYKSIQKYDAFTKNIIINFINFATVAMYRQWVKDGRKIPMENMIELAVKLIKSGVNIL